MWNCPLCILMVHRLKFLNSVPKDGQTVQTSYAAFHLGLHYLPKYLFTGISRMKRVNVRLKEINIWAIILVPLIMTLSRGHTGQIKRTVVMRWLWLPYRGNKVAPWRDLVFYDKILIFILVIEIVIYTGKSPLEAPIILWATETVPYQLIL